MGHGASVAAAAVAPRALQLLSPAQTQAIALSRVAFARAATAAHAAEQLRAVAEAHAERLVLARVRWAAAHAEAASKRWFVRSVSTTSAASAFAIDLRDVWLVRVAKRRYEVHTSGPELLDVPTLRGASAAAASALELRDPQVLEFLLATCRWTAWKPPTSWRLKADQLFDLTVHVRSRRDGSLTGGERLVRLRVGRKWLGPHHHNADAGFGHDVKSQWLHRVDYEPEDDVRSAESAFYQTLALAWDNYVLELAKVPQEDLRSGEEAGRGFPYDEQERATHLRVKYLLATSLERILGENGTLFRAAQQYELWRMAQEDAERHRGAESREDHFAGPLLDAHIEELTQLFEQQAMELEDVKPLELPAETDAVQSTSQENDGRRVVEEAVEAAAAAPEEKVA